MDSIISVLGTILSYLPDSILIFIDNWFWTILLLLITMMVSSIIEKFNNEPKNLSIKEKASNMSKSLNGLGIMIIIAIGYFFSSSLVSDTVEQKLQDSFKDSKITYQEMDCSGLLNISCEIEDVNLSDGFSYNLVTIDGVITPTILGLLKDGKKILDSKAESLDNLELEIAFSGALKNGVPLMESIQQENNLSDDFLDVLKDELGGDVSFKISMNAESEDNKTLFSLDFNGGTDKILISNNIAVFLKGDKAIKESIYNTFFENLQLTIVSEGDLMEIIYLVSEEEYEKYKDDSYKLKQLSYEVTGKATTDKVSKDDLQAFVKIKMIEELNKIKPLLKTRQDIFTTLTKKLDSLSKGDEVELKISITPQKEITIQKLIQNQSIKKDIYLSVE